MAQNGNDMRSVVIIAGCRIPFLRSGSGYGDLMSYDLARLALKGLLDRTQIAPEAVDLIIMGTVLSNYVTSNVARDAALAAGFPHTVPAFTVTQACISANQAITAGVDRICTGHAEVVIAGGAESLSDIPIRYQKKVRRKLIETQKYRKKSDYLKFIRGLSLKDLLPEIPAIAEFSTGRTMGQDCDRLAARLGVTRAEQDEFAARSHRLAAKAWSDGMLAEEVTQVRIPPEFETITTDNGIRADSSMQKLQSLPAAFEKPYGSVTAGNSSFLTDGAAAVLLMSEDYATANGHQPKARVRAYAYTAQDPLEELLLGPAYATPKVLERAGLQFGDIDVVEFHEAFAGQVLANLKCLASAAFAREKLGKDHAVGDVALEKLNTWGGSLSIGHPFGATGARLVTTAANRLHKEDGALALVASCAAGALGNAIVLERCD